MDRNFFVLIFVVIPFCMAHLIGCADGKVAGTISKTKPNNGQKLTQQSSQLLNDLSNKVESFSAETNPAEIATQIKTVVSEKSTANALSEAKLLAQALDNLSVVYSSGTSIKITMNNKNKTTSGAWLTVTGSLSRERSELSAKVGKLAIQQSTADKTTRINNANSADNTIKVFGECVDSDCRDALVSIYLGRHDAVVPIYFRLLKEEGLSAVKELQVTTALDEGLKVQRSRNPVDHDAVLAQSASYELEYVIVPLSDHISKARLEIRGREGGKIAVKSEALDMADGEQPRKVLINTGGDASSSDEDAE